MTGQQRLLNAALVHADRLIDQNTVGGFILGMQNAVISGQKIDRLRVFLSSGGGDADSGARLYYYLKALPYTVEMIGFGNVDSAALVVLMAGAERVAVRGCRFLLDEGTYTVATPTAHIKSHEAAMRELTYLRDRMISIIAAESERTIEEISEMARRAGYSTSTTR